jgi:hypothetical protein
LPQVVRIWQREWKVFSPQWNVYEIRLLARG